MLVTLRNSGNRRYDFLAIYRETQARYVVGCSSYYGVRRHGCGFLGEGHKTRSSPPDYSESLPQNVEVLLGSLRNVRKVQKCNRPQHVSEFKSSRE